MSPNLIHFKAYLRGFHLGGGGGERINWTSGDIKHVAFLGRKRRGKAIGVEGFRELDSWHLISLSFFYFHDYEL